MERLQVTRTSSSSSQLTSVSSGQWNHSHSCWDVIVQHGTVVSLLNLCFRVAEIQCVFPFLSPHQDVVSFHDYDERVVVQWAPVSASAKAAPIIADTPELTFGMQLPKEPSAHRAAVAGDVCCGRFHPMSNTTLLVQKKQPCQKHSFFAGIFEPIWCRTQSQACMDRICSYLFYKSNAQPTLSWGPHCKKTNIIQQPKAYQMHDALSSAIQ